MVVSIRPFLGFRERFRKVAGKVEVIGFVEIRLLSSWVAHLCIIF